MNLIPLELIESIVYLLDPDDLDAVNIVYHNKFIFTINWSTVHMYRFGKYKNMNYDQYHKMISVEEVKTKLKLNESIDELIEIIILELSSNKLTEIPNSIGILQQLQYLDLSSNQLTKIPESIGNLPQLQNLYLYGNKLTEIPDSIIIFGFI